jgi:tol-pal system protein YbgF
MKQRLLLSLVTACLVLPSARAALFEDEQARRAILELRQRLDGQRGPSETLTREVRALSEDNQQLKRALLDLQAQIESLRSEMAQSRGDRELTLRELAETQRRIKDQAQAVEERIRQTEDRLRPLEPIKISTEGPEFLAQPSEKREFDAALQRFRASDFGPAAGAFADFIRRYPRSGYIPSALFWLGNAQYATRDYKEAIQNFKSMLSVAAEHPRAADAMLSLANCQFELKDSKSGRRTLEDLLKKYPQAEAAQAAQERLTRLK